MIGEPDPCGAFDARAEASTAEGAVTVGSLCSGYTGLDMGLALALGVPVRHVWHVENDPAPSKILAAHYPAVPNYGDLKTLDFALMERVDILTAGYPCQPFSDAGLRKGADDPRHLWPYVADAIGALRPRLVLLENVRGHVRRGLDSVLADLAALGYDASWGLVRASDAGAPHQRARIFIVATDASDKRHERAGAARHGWHGLADQRHAAPHAPRGSVPDEPAGGDSAALTLRAELGAGVGAVPRRDAEGDHLTGRGARIVEPAADPASDGRLQGWTEPARVVGGPDAPERGPQAAPDADRRGLEGCAQRNGGEAGPGLEASQRADADGRLLDWGVYEPAIERWAGIIGRPAPWATEPRGRGGAERLSPYQRAGWHVTAVDIDEAALRRNPADEKIGGDALDVLRRLIAGLGVQTLSGKWLFLADFDAAHASFPCQHWAANGANSAADKWPDLITPGRALLDATGLPWVMENVPKAPLRRDLILCGTHFGLTATDTDGTLLHLDRHRVFESNAPLSLPDGAHPVSLHRCGPRPGVQWAGVYGGARKDKVEARAIRKGGYVPPSADVQSQLLGGVPWMTGKGRRECIPPVYAEHVGRQLLAAVEAREVAA